MVKNLYNDVNSKIYTVGTSSNYHINPRNAPTTMEQTTNSASTRHQSPNLGRLDKTPQNQDTQDPLTDCPECGGRNWIVIPGIKGSFSVPCPACNAEGVRI